MDLLITRRIELFLVPHFSNSQLPFHKLQYSSITNVRNYTFHNSYAILYIKATLLLCWSHPYKNHKIVITYWFIITKYQISQKTRVFWHLRGSLSLIRHLSDWTIWLNCIKSGTAYPSRSTEFTPFFCGACVAHLFNFLLHYSDVNQW